MMKTKILLLSLIVMLGLLTCKKDKIQPDITKGLVSYFNFDDNAIDQQGYASISAAKATYSVGKIGKAISFNGIDEAISYSATPSQTSSGFSVSFWIKGDASPDQFGRRILIFNDDNNFGSFTVSQQNIFDYFIGNQVGSLSYPFVAQTWMHVVGVYDGQNTNLYINGTSVGTLTGNGNTSAYFKTLTLAYDPANNRFWSGSIDELRIYDRAISQEEVTQLYNLK